MAGIQAVKQRFGIIGRSPLLDRALSTAVRVAPTDLTVLITGERWRWQGSIFENNPQPELTKTQQVHCCELWRHS